jgi:hypothetical protein
MGSTPRTDSVFSTATLKDAIATVVFTMSPKPLRRTSVLTPPLESLHQINNVDAEDLLILYAFAVSDFRKIQYHF